MTTSLNLLVCDSVTRMGPQARGSVVIAASHGGVFAAHFALSEGVCGLVLCDAGVGLNRAGIAGLEFAQQFGVPCASISSASARIGDGADCADNGVISHTNACAEQLGILVGMPAMDAARLMAAAHLKVVDPGPQAEESRVEIASQGRRIVLMDSASLVEPQDTGAIAITASHGGLLGAKPETAIKQPVFAALYNDAGLGCDRAGISRLPVLDARGIAGVTVAAYSACIGDARSAWERGVLSHVNQRAKALGSSVGQTVQEWARLMAMAK